MSKIEDITAILQTYDSAVTKVVLSKTQLAEKTKESVLQNLEDIKTQNLIHKNNLQDIVDMAKLDAGKATELKARLENAVAAKYENKVIDTLTRTKLEEELETAGVTVAKRQEILARYDNAAAVKKESDALELYATGIGNSIKNALGWMKTHWVITALTIAVGVFALKVRDTNKDIEAANKAVEEYAEKCSELQSALLSNQRSVAAIKDDFAKLSKGISESGENIGLTTDEFDRYNSIANQIAEMFPDIVQGYTDQGNAILSCKDNVDALTKALEDQQKAYHQTILDGVDDVYTAWNNKWNEKWHVSFAEKFFPEANFETTLTELISYLEIIERLANADADAFGGLLDEIRAKGTDRFETLGGGYTIGTTYKAPADYKAVTAMLAGALGGSFDVSGDNLGVARNAVQELYESLLKEISDGTSTETEQLREAIRSHLALTDAFDGIDAETRATISGFVNALDYEFFRVFSNDHSFMYDWIDQFVIAPLNDSKTKGAYKKALAFFVSQGADITKLSANTFEFFPEFVGALEKLKAELSKGNDTDLIGLYDSSQDVKSLMDLLRELGMISGVTEDSILAIARAFARMDDAATTSVDNTTDKIADLTKSLTDIVEKFDFVKQVQEDFANTGIITAETLASIIEKFPDMAYSVNLYIVGIKSAKELLDDLSVAYKTDENAWREDQKAKLYTSTEFCNALTNDQSKLIDELAKSYGVDLDNFRTIEEAKADIQQQIIQQLADNYSRYANATLVDLKARISVLRAQLETTKAVSTEDSTGINDAFIARKKELAALMNAIRDIEGAYKGLDEILLSSYDPSKFSSYLADSMKDATDSAEDEFEKFKNKWNDWFSDREFEVNLKYREGDIDGAVELYNQMIAQAQALLQEAYADGLTMDDDWVQNLMTKIHEYTSAIEEFAEQEVKKFQDKWNDWFSDMEFMVNLKYEVGDLDGANELYQQMVNKAQELLNDAYAEGMTIDDDWVQDFITKVNTYKKALADLRIEEYDKLIEYNDKFDVWNHVDYTKLDKLKEKLAAINDQYIAGLRTYQDWYEIFTKTASEIYEIQRDALDELLSSMQDALEQQIEDQIQGIEDASDAQIEALEKEKSA